MRTWAWTAALLAACTCGDGGADDAAAAANESLSKLAHCLLGGPLDPAESAARRAREVELGASLGARPEPAWPARCASFGQTLASDLERAAEADAEKFGAAHREAVAAQTALGRGEVPSNLDALFAAALGTSLVPVPVEDTSVPAAPPRARPLSGQAIGVLAPGNASFAATDPVAVTPTHVAFATPDGPWRVCTFSHDLTSAQCRGFAAASGRAEVAFVGSAAGAPPHLLVKRSPAGEPGIYAVETGGRVWDGIPTGAFVRRDGTMAVLDGNELVQQRDVAVRERVAAPARGPSAMVWDRIVWLGEAPAGQNRPLLVQRVPGGVAPLGEPEPLGPGPVVPAPVFVAHACRSQDALVFVTLHAHDHEKDIPTFFSFLLDGGESATVEALSDIYGPELGCRGEAAQLTWLLTKPDGVEMNQQRCTVQGCTRVRQLLQFDGSDPLFGTIGDGKTILVWKSPLGDTRMRIAPLEQIGTAPPVVLFDDAAHGGMEVLQRRLLLRGDHALLVLRTREGARALRISADGSFVGVRLDR